MAKQKSQKEYTDVSMSLVEHLTELKRRLTFSVIFFLLGFALSYAFKEHIYQFLLEPLKDLYAGQEGRRLIYTGLAEAFFTYLKVSMFGGFIVAFPVIGFQLYRFLAPGLYKKEKKVFLPFLIMAPVLFLAGGAMAYYFIFPLAWDFFLSFETVGSMDALPIQLEARVSEYLSLVMRIIIGFGLAFQLPIVLLLLAHAGFVKAEGLAKKRKFAVIGVFLLAAMLTPPDVISQIGLAIPLLILYESAVFGCRWIEEKDKA